MKWGSGDDQAALVEYKTRIERWFIMKGIKEEDQHNFIIFQAGDKGEELSKTWTLSPEDLKVPSKNFNSLLVWQTTSGSTG